jgi:hypothetical protein
MRTPISILHASKSITNKKKKTQFINTELSKYSITRAAFEDDVKNGDFNSRLMLLPLTDEALLAVCEPTDIIQHTPLSFALQEELDPYVIQLLLDHGATFDQKVMLNNGTTATIRDACAVQIELFMERMCDPM